jgi:16S rRNA (uracil1498-N3)-methyltransferase
VRQSRLYTDQPLQAGSRVELDARAAHYVTQVLRLRKGQSLTLFNGDGHDWSAELDYCGRRDCRVHVLEILEAESLPRRALHLAVGLSRGERMDLVIQKAVELGVTDITPLHTQRSVVQLDAERSAKRLSHWHGIVVSACEQSGRMRLPQLNPITDITVWLAAGHNGFMLDHRAKVSLAGSDEPAGDIALLVGPEGGLAAPERQLAARHGFTAVRLGPRVLRTETAPLAALAAIQTLWGDFR